MNSIKRMTVNIPEQLMAEAQTVTKKNMTETLIEGLRLLKRSRAYGKAQPLRGRIDLSIDLDVSRERAGR